MKKKLTAISPFLLLLVPFFVAISLVWATGSNDTELVREQLAIRASLITLPEINIFQAVLWWK